MNKHYRAWAVVFLIVAAQVALIWYFFVARKSSAEADARIFAQRQREFDEVTSLQQLAIESLEPIPRPTPVLLRQRYDAQSVGSSSRNEAIIHASIGRAARDKVECAIRIEGNTLIRSFDPKRDTMTLETKQKSESVLMKTESKIFPGSNLYFKSTATLTEDRRGRISGMTGIMTVGGKMRDYPKVIAPLIFPDREVTVGTEWSLHTRDGTGGSKLGQVDVSRATARLSAFVMYQKTPCARIDADVVSSGDPKTVFGGPVNIPSIKDGKKVGVKEKRVYLVRLTDGAVLWNETISDLEGIGKITTRVGLLADN